MFKNTKILLGMDRIVKFRMKKILPFLPDLFSKSFQ